MKPMPAGSTPSYNNCQCAMTKRFLITLLVVAFSVSATQGATSVESVGMTVSDMDRAVEFYSALTFQKISDVEVLGEEFEHLEGVFGARMRIVRMQLGKEYLDLTQYLAPPGRPIPVDSRSNDLWFQHIAIVVRDMDQAFDKLRALKVQFVSTDHKRCRRRSKPQLELRRSISVILISTTWKSFTFRLAKATRAGRRRPTIYSSGSTTLPLESQAQTRVCIFIATCSDCAERARAKISGPNKNI